MNALLKSKQDAAKTRLAEIEIPKDWRKDRAETARDWLLLHGMPHRRDHFWSYTDPAQLTGETAGSEASLPEFSYPKVKPDLSEKTEGLEILPLRDANSNRFGDIIARAHEKGERPLAELALIEAMGAVINVKGAGGVLHLDHADWPETGYLRVNLAENASLTLVESTNKAAQRSLVIEADLGKNSKFDHVRILPQMEDRLHLQIFADLAENADFRSFNLAAPSLFRRLESVVNLNGDHGHVSVAGANLLNQKAFHDDTVYITHNAENCTSRQVFKRVIGADARSIFQGKIYVKEGAQKTDGYQISQGLMLEDGGEALSKPELEIYADDVACSHGSTTSGLDENMLFYLRSRGIDQPMAKKLLVRAFLEEAFEEIRDESILEPVTALAEEWIFGSAL